MKGSLDRKEKSKGRKGREWDLLGWQTFLFDEAYDTIGV